MIILKTGTRSVLARLALISATLIWGSSFFMMKSSLDSIEPFYLLAIRFSIAAAVLSLIFFPKFKLMDKGYIKGGVVMGVFLAMAYGVQTMGLRFTTPGKNAFLTAVYCLIVPFLYWAAERKKPDGYNIAAAVICLVGIGFVSINPSDGGGVNKGDLLTLCGGFMYACHIIAVNKASKGRDITALTIIQFATAACVFLAAGVLFNKAPRGLETGTALTLLYLGIFSTAAALLLQGVGQKYTPPSQAALLLSLEAVFGVMFSVIFADERLTVQLVIGFILIFSAVVISEVKPGHKPKPGKEMPYEQ